jgi:dTDP-4-amino-4,6-dideoxygalactose transaminase
MPSIPPIDLTQQYRTLSPELLPVIEDLLASGSYINGPQVEALEEQLAEFLGCRAVVSCNSGTDALYLALRALDIGVGDEVITSPFSFFATAEAISLTGARPVFVDIDATTFNLDPDRIEASITPRTRAILPVHLFGQPVNMTAVMAIAQRHHLAVVEDCAQATGASWQGRQVGTFGQMGCFSFFPTKNLGAMGDGGAISTSDLELAAKLKRLKNHGSDRRYFHQTIGINSRLDTLQAAILLVKLPYLEEWNQRRRAIALQYRNLLADVPHLVLPADIEGGQSVWNQFTVRVLPETDRPASSQHSDSFPPRCRDRVKEQLQAEGIASMIYYPLPIHLQAAYESLGHQPGDFPMAEQCADQVLSLPLFPELTLDRQQSVATALSHILSGTSVNEIPTAV